MPTLDISLKDLNKLIGKELTYDEIEGEAILLIKGEIDGVDGDDLKVDCKDSNRPDLWSTEGIARAIAPSYTDERGIREYPVEESGVYLHVDRSVDDVRPFIVAAILEEVEITEDLLKQLIQIQEKVCLSFGRKRKTVAMGIYDFDKIEAPLKYKAVKPESVKFVPLEFKVEMDLNEILQEHPKGREYAHLLEGHNKYPLVMDSKNNVLSMPPVINSQYSGKVTEKTRNLFVEVTGTNLEDCKVALNVLVAAVADRGAKIKSVELDYGEEKVVTPDFSPKKIKVKFDEIERLTGMKLTIKEMKELLEKYNYNVKKAKDALEVEYPSYRQDILHPVDVIEDLLIMMGYNSIEPEVPEIATIGSINELELFCEDVRNLLVGFGANELLNFTMTNKEVQFTKMNLEDEKIVEIANPVSSKWSCLRTWLLPSLMEFFKRNVSYEYPQQIYEVGDYVELNASMETGTFSGKKLAWALADKDSNFTKAKQIMVFVLKAIGVDYEVIEEDLGQFIPGRSARVKVGNQFVGFVGEIHPVVLKNFGVEFPVCSFELDISKLFKLKE